MNVLENKKALIFNQCKKESEAFITEYSDSEQYAWKYLYKTNVILSKLFQYMNALE